MKHAILIMAHKDYAHLNRLVNYFCKDCMVFIHVDKQSDFSKEEIDELSQNPYVARIYKKYNIHWGGFSMLKCELFLLNSIIKEYKVDYIHLLSGQDYPIKPLNYMLNFFEEHQGVDFLSYVHLPNYKWQDNTYARFAYFYLYDWLKRGQRRSKFMDKFVLWQKKVGFKRSVPNYFEHLYGGSQWFSITFTSAESIMAYTKKHRRFYYRLMFTFAPEECYIHTVLLNVQNKNKVFPKNYRFIRWVFENNNYPCNLGVEHFHLLANNDNLFARKFERPYCDRLLPMIDKYLLKENELQILSDGTWVYDGLYKYKQRCDILVHRISQYYYWMNYNDLLDAGCGAGFMVAAFRRRNIPATGIDSNPFVESLSSMILPENDLPCECVNLARPITVVETYDLVLCLNVLEFMSCEHLNTAIENLVRLTKCSLIIGFTTNDSDLMANVKELIGKISSHSFYINKSMTKYIDSDPGRCILVLERKEYSTF